MEQPKEPEGELIYPREFAPMQSREKSFPPMQRPAVKEVTHAGLALMAGDTGRVLTLQRALDDKDPAGGKFEFPGGGLEEGESPIEGAIREWKEETGCQLPPGQITHDWLSNGMYRGFVYVVPEEKALEINGSPDDRQVLNPDDPDGDCPEVALWMHPKDLKDHPATRKEVKNGTDWSVFTKARKKTAATSDEAAIANALAIRDEYNKNATDWADHVRVRAGHLENPRDGSLSWHHGSPAKWGQEPEEEEFDDYDREPPSQHWNTHLGTHWTSVPEVAEQFAKGKYDKTRTTHEVKADPGQVYTANLGIKNPKVYRSEHHMDKEAYDHAWEGEDRDYPHDPGHTEDYPDGVRDKYEHDAAHWLSSHPEVDDIASSFKRHLQSQGHDGVVYGNAVEGPHLHPSAITFDEGQHHNVQRRWANQPREEQGRLFEARIVSAYGHIAMEDPEYGGHHRPMEGPPLHDLTAEGEDGQMWPDDVYDHPEWYNSSSSEHFQEGVRAIHRYRGKPEAMATIYRAAPKGLTHINPGDWVTPVASYARLHGRKSKSTQDWPIYKAQVPAKHVLNGGMEPMYEWGYSGPPVEAKQHTKGGRDAEWLRGTEPSPKEGSMKLHLASDEIVVPRNIDTLRDSTCAVCGSEGTMNGDRCTVCGYMATPQAFQSPDTSLAPKVREELGIGNPMGDDTVGAPDSGLEGPPGAEDELEGMGEGPEGLEGEEGLEGGGDLICDNCGATFDSQEEEEDLSEPYLSPSARIEPDVSALGVQDDLEVARDVAQEENQAGTNEDVAYQEGDECPVCGEGTLVPNEEPEGEEEGLPGEEGEMVDEQGPPGEEEPGEEVEGEPQEEEPGEEGPEGEEAPPQAQAPDEGEEDHEDEEEGDGPPFRRRQRKESSTMATQTPRRQGQVPPARRPPSPTRQATAANPNPAAVERRRLFQALEATAAAINRQADRLEAQDRLLAQVGHFVRQAHTKISELSVRNETLERQMALVANASGLMEPLATIGAAGQARVATLYGKRANPANPAQPVPEPASEPPLFTSPEAVQAAGRDDVTQLGATPVSDVAADATTDLSTPYGELANEPVGMNRTDVTAPVQGTETATPPEMTVIPVDTRIGNPDDPTVAFPFTVGPVGAPSRPYQGPSVGNPPTTAAQRPGEPGVAVHPQAQAHYIASVNLARLRAQVGITNEEPFQLGTKIAGSMTDAQINAEAQGLQAVASRQANQPQAPVFAPGLAFEPVTSIPDARPMVPHMASANGNGSILPADPSFQAGKYGPGPGSAIQATTMFAPREDEFGWDSPL
jgi:8-oxo-dGTP pyrophosphatase MutT (NUDIX family)